MNRALRLRAEDSEDLKIVAAVLQDALVPMSEMEFLNGEGCFAMIANRFKWENCEETWDSPVTAVTDGAAEETAGDVAFECHSYERVNCGVRFNGVSQVRCKGMDRRDRGRVLELLTITAEPDAVILMFAGGAAIRLEGSSITCHIEDLGEPWPTRWRPYHPDANTV